MMDNINTHLLEHPLTDNESDLKEKFEIALDSLWDAYQLIGNKEGFYEDENNYLFPGKIAVGRFYNKVLNQTEVLQNYNAQKSRFGL